MLQIGICCSPNSYYLADLIEKYLNVSGFNSFCLLPLAPQEIGRRMREIQMLVVLLDSYWLESPEATSEIDIIDDIIDNSSDSLRLTFVSLEKFDFDNMYTTYSTCSGMPSCISCPLARLLNTNFAFLKIFGSGILIDGAQNPQMIMQMITNLANKLVSDIESGWMKRRPKLITAEGQQSGTLEISARAVFPPSVKLSISVWEVGRKLVEYDDGFTSIFGADKIEDVLDVITSPGFIRENQDHIRRSVLKGMKLHHQPILCDNTVCQINLNNTILNVMHAVKGIYDQDGNLSGAISFTALLDDRTTYPSPYPVIRISLNTHHNRHNRQNQDASYESGYELPSLSFLEELGKDSPFFSSPPSSSSSSSSFSSSPSPPSLWVSQQSSQLQLHQDLHPGSAKRRKFKMIPIKKEIKLLDIQQRKKIHMLCPGDFNSDVIQPSPFQDTIQIKRLTFRNCDGAVLWKKKAQKN